MKKNFIYFLFILPLYFIAQSNNSNSEILKKYFYTMEILKKVKENEKINHPENLKSYQYFVYNKFYIDEYTAPYSPALDSINNSTRNDKEYLFLGERIIENLYDQKFGKKYIITADQVSGFKEPFYELFNEKIVPDEFPDILKNEFTSYNFRLKDSITLEQRKTYVIAFGSKKNILLNGSRGEFYVDAQSFALVKYSGEEYRNEYTRYFEYNWKPFRTIWYLENKTNKIKFRTFDFLKFLNQKQLKQNMYITPWIVIQSTTSGFSVPDTLSRKKFTGYTYELDKNYATDTESKISLYRPVPLNKSEKLTYESTHSLFDLFPVEKTMRSFLSLKKRELPLGQFTMDLKNILSFNDYEGFRIQLGGKTNYKFSENYSLHGYGAFGTKDKDFKGSLGADVFMNKKYDGKLQLTAASDVNPFSRNIIRRPQTLDQLEEQLNYIQNPVFYSFRKGEVSYSQDFLKRLNVSFSLDYQTQRANYKYSYKNESSRHWFNQFTSSVSLKYAPFAEYMQTPEGKMTIDDKPVYFYFTYSKGWKGLDTDFDYHKFDFSSDISIKNPLGNSSFFLNSGYISGKTALWNLYGSFGNAKTGNAVFKRFSAKGFHSLETLAPGDFFADKYVSLFFTHTFNNIQLWEGKKIHIAVVYNGMIGNMEHRNLHSLHHFEVPEKLYQEAGIEINNLISYFGLGAYYRIGAYNKGNFDDNLFLKLTFHLF